MGGVGGRGGAMQDGGVGAELTGAQGTWEMERRLGGLALLCSQHRESHPQPLQSNRCPLTATSLETVVPEFLLPNPGTVLQGGRAVL